VWAPNGILADTSASHISHAIDYAQSVMLFGYVERVDMRARQYVAYYRVSSAQQGFSGLGLEAQRASVQQFVEKQSGKLVAEFSEIKSGWKSKRPQLAEALRVCRMRRAVLVIARLDRLARNVALISGLMESDLEFVAVDFPLASRLTIHMLAAIAEYESKLLSRRIKAAFAAARARGIKMSGAGRKFGHVRTAVTASVAARRAKATARALDIVPTIRDLREQKKTLSEIAEELTRLRIRTPRNRVWTRQGVRNILRRAAREQSSTTKSGGNASNMNVIRARHRAEALAPLVWRLRREGESPSSIARELERREIATPKGAKWRVPGIMRIFRQTATAYALPEDHEFLERGDNRKNRALKRTIELGQLAWDLRNEGCSCAAIGKEFERRKIEPPRGPRWNPSTVWRLLLSARPGQAQFAGTAPADRLGHSEVAKKRLAMKFAPAIWNLRALGKTVWAIAGELNRGKIASPQGRRWHHDSVTRVLHLTRDQFAPFAKIVAAQPAARAAGMRKLAEYIWKLRLSGMSQVATAHELTNRGIKTPSGKPTWRVGTVQYVLSLAASDFVSSAEALADLPHPRRVHALKRAMKVASFAWKLRAKGESWAGIATEFDRLGIAAPNGGHWHPASVGKLLRRTAAEFEPIAATVAADPSPRRIRALARASELAPIAWEMRTANKTMDEIANELNRRKIRTPRRQPWRAGTVSILLRKTAGKFAPNHQALSGAPPVEDILRRKAS
jgi:DNA invertase Pin-like site-specific DNA recombinase